MAINLGKFSGKKIPTIIGMVLLLVGMVAGVLAVGQQQGWFTKAGPTATPRSVKITNVKEDSFTVSWVSDTSVSGFIKYGDSASNMKLTIGDSRDQTTGTASLYTTHFINVKGLKPTTTYYFELGSGSQTYNNEGQPYKVTTAANLANPPAADTINGKVLLASGQPAPGVIVYVDMDGGAPLSTLTRSSGVWTLPLSQIRTVDLAKYLTYDKTNGKISITVTGADLGSATATVTTNNDSPVPDITLGQTQNFQAQGTPPQAGTPSAQVATATPSAVTLPAQGEADGQVATASAGAGFGGLADLESAYEATLSVKLKSIAEGETIATSSPEIKIQAPVGTKIKITVHSNFEQTTTVTADADGLVDWTPPEGLEPGEHEVTLEYVDENGITQTIVKKFTVLAAEPDTTYGGLPAFTATPSAEVTATPSARTTMPSTESGVPESGVMTPTLILLIAGSLLFVGGIIWQQKLARILNIFI